jgi:hypothetical protein
MPPEKTEAKVGAIELLRLPINPTTQLASRAEETYRINWGLNELAIAARLSEFDNSSSDLIGYL